MSDDLRKSLPFCLLVAVVFGVCYGGASWWTSRYESLPAWDFPFEHGLPFVPELAIVYLTITPVLLLGPFLLRKHDEVALLAAMLSIETLIATGFFLLVPQSTAFLRPEVTGWARIPFEVADTLNLRYNEFPSLHVAFAFTAAWMYRRMAWKFWAVAVAVSTLLIREHHLADIAGGIALAALVMPLVRREGSWAELCCLYQCWVFSRRHVRYFVIFLAIYLPSLLHWRKYRAVRLGFCAAQWIDDLLDGDRPSAREPLQVVDGLLVEMERRAFSSQPLSRLTRAFFAEVSADAQRDFMALVRCMRVDRLRVLGGQRWSAVELEEHHRGTFSLSVNLMLITAHCTARAQQVPSLIGALAWCSVFRDLEDDLRKGLVNIPREADLAVWTREEHAGALLLLERSAREIACLEDPRARRILGIFQSSVTKFARRRSRWAIDPVRPSLSMRTIAPDPHSGATNSASHQRSSPARPRLGL